MLHHFSCFLGLFLLTAAGCGSTIDVTIAGQPFSVADEISAVSTSAGGAGARIALFSQGGVCASLTAGHAFESEQMLVIELATVGAAGSTAPTEPGTFTVKALSEPEPSTGGVAAVIFSTFAADCSQTVFAAGESGTVTLRSVDDGAYAGSVDVTLNSGDHLTFDFASSACPAAGDVKAMEMASCG